ncbi:MAG: DoxX family protein, partial [Flavitalea sp.]
MKISNVLLWICRIVAAVILLQTLFFKFSAAPESVYIFSTLGMEPWGRIGSGIAELIASVLLLIPRVSVFGACLALGIMAGAIASHLLVLGIEIMGDGGQLFIYALLVTIASAYIVIVSRSQLIA